MTSPTTKTKTLVPVEEIKVVKWGVEDEKVERNPGVDVWMVRRVDEPRYFVPWYKKDSAQVKELSELYPEMSFDAAGAIEGGFLNGRVLEDPAVTIRTCGGKDRPRYVYRVVHEGNEEVGLPGHPFGGLKARGYGLVQTDPHYFQLLLQKHLVWKTRHVQSPFLSVTNRKFKARSIAEFYHERGYLGIKIMLIDTTSNAWDHPNQRLWKVNYLVDKLRLTKHEYFESEWVVENEIPEAAVVDTFYWSSDNEERAKANFDEWQSDLADSRDKQKRWRATDDHKILTLVKRDSRERYQERLAAARQKRIDRKANKNAKKTIINTAAGDGSAAAAAAETNNNSAPPDQNTQPLLQAQAAVSDSTATDGATIPNIDTGNDTDTNGYTDDEADEQPSLHRLPYCIQLAMLTHRIKGPGSHGNISVRDVEQLVAPRLKRTRAKGFLCKGRAK